MNGNIVVNTIVFNQLVTAGVKQWELFESVKSLGISKIEIRREWIVNFAEEMHKMKVEAANNNIELLYSVPAALFTDNRLDTTGLVQYLNEAKSIGAKMVKFTVGDFEPSNNEALAHLKGILQDRQVIVTVENDQTAANGKAAALKTFLDCCKKNDVPVYCTYDIGNWCWVNENPVANVPKLAEYTKYIHLKDVAYQNGEPIVQSLDNGEVDWRTVLKMLPQNVLLGIEFPCGDQPLAVLKDALDKLADLSK